jgi:hypothetical protein
MKLPDISLDAETVAVMKATLDEAWSSLTPAQKAQTSRSAMAERILALVARGERNPDRLFVGALLEAIPIKNASWVVYS